MLHSHRRQPALSISQRIRNNECRNGASDSIYHFRHSLFLIRCDIPTGHFTSLPTYSAIIGTLIPACFANAIASG